MYVTEFVSYYILPSAIVLNWNKLTCGSDFSWSAWQPVFRLAWRCVFLVQSASCGDAFISSVWIQSSCYGNVFSVATAVAMETYFLPMPLAFVLCSLCFIHQRLWMVESQNGWSNYWMFVSEGKWLVLNRLKIVPDVVAVVRNNNSIFKSIGCIGSLWLTVINPVIGSYMVLLGLTMVDYNPKSGTDNRLMSRSLLMAL